MTLMSFSWLFMPWNPKISAFVVISVSYLRFSCDFLPRGESATFLLATMRAGLTSSDHMHRIASVCNPSDLFCTNKNSIGRPYASHRTICIAAHRTICTVSHQLNFFVQTRTASSHMNRIASVASWRTKKSHFRASEENGMKQIDK